MTPPPSHQADPSSALSLIQFYTNLRGYLDSQHSPPTLPTETAILQATTAVVPDFGQGGLRVDPQPLGQANTLEHILRDIVPALNGQAQSSRYYGFVTGGVLPVAEAADNVVSALDQNVQVHLPAQTIATRVEDAALRMLIRLLELEGKEHEDENEDGDVDRHRWKGRTFTTGATASNVLGLACGREAVIAKRLPAGASVGEMGILAACQAAGIRKIQVLTSMGHSSLYKAASIVGLGRASVKELPMNEDRPWELDIAAVQQELQRDGVANIIAISAGEVNTGLFAVGRGQMKELRNMADAYGAWIHVDGGQSTRSAGKALLVDTLIAFGIFARALPKTPMFDGLHTSTLDLELADSMTLDGHKMLNVVSVFNCQTSPPLN
jgi:glutamate/tyrosine decarboxylase-like PLP-dependent enzyme